MPTELSTQCAVWRALRPLSMTRTIIWSTKACSDAIEAHDTPVLFDWMVRAFSFQGIADAIAADYMDKHGALTWAAIAADLDAGPACPKLQSYWQFHACGYRKGSGTCNEPDQFSGCPLPRHPLRNGRLNQTAYSLFLFIRDIADGDLVAWIDTSTGRSG